MGLQVPLREAPVCVHRHPSMCPRACARVCVPVQASVCLCVCASVCMTMCVRVCVCVSVTWRAPWAQPSWGGLCAWPRGLQQGAHGGGEPRRPHCTVHPLGGRGLGPGPRVCRGDPSSPSPGDTAHQASVTLRQAGVSPVHREGRRCWVSTCPQPRRCLQQGEAWAGVTQPASQQGPEGTGPSGLMRPRWDPVGEPQKRDTWGQVL